jgi:hypothetical protein
VVRDASYSMRTGSLKAIFIDDMHDHRF